ncbi:MAG: hypothetical protein LBH65_05920 [Desulfovibrio sp.]|nr:hypothetical protein [Desulfovibrio sp.]
MWKRTARCAAYALMRSEFRWRGPQRNAQAATEVRGAMTDLNTHMVVARQ